MEKQISIIIPTYNMEKYIGKCLDSLLISEIDQVEVLVVNDGSKDRSSEIAHEYANRFPNSIRVIDKENGNYGSCINAALPQCTGRYVKVLDADDTFDTKAFSEFIKRIPKITTDVIISSFCQVNEQGEMDKIVDYGMAKYDDTKIYRFEDVVPVLFQGVFMHALSYKTSRLIELNYRQTEGISYTDNEWTFTPIAMANSFFVLNIPPIYRYLVGRDGQTMDSSVFLKATPHRIKLCMSLADRYENANVTGLRKHYLEHRLSAIFIMLYRIALEDKSNSQRNTLTEFDNNLKKLHPKMYKFSSNINIAPHVKYKFIKHFRVNPPDYTIPGWVNLYENIIIKVSQLRSLFS